MCISLPVIVNIQLCSSFCFGLQLCLFPPCLWFAPMLLSILFADLSSFYFNYMLLVMFWHCYSVLMFYVIILSFFLGLAFITSPFIYPCSLLTVISCPRRTKLSNVLASSTCIIPSLYHLVLFCSFSFIFCIRYHSVNPWF